jgi:hypothetical protein
MDYVCWPSVVGAAVTTARMNNVPHGKLLHVCISLVVR